MKSIFVFLLLASSFLNAGEIQEKLMRLYDSAERITEEKLDVLRFGYQWECFEVNFLNGESTQGDTYLFKKNMVGWSVDNQGKTSHFFPETNIIKEYRVFKTDLKGIKRDRAGSSYYEFQDGLRFDPRNNTLLGITVYKKIVRNWMEMFGVLSMKVCQ